MRGSCSAAYSETGDVQIPTQEPARALFGLPQATQLRAALARALADDAHEALGAEVARVVPAHVSLATNADWQAHGAVVLLIAAVTLWMLHERVAACACSARARRERIALQVRRGQLLRRAAGLYWLWLPCHPSATSDESAATTGDAGLATHVARASVCAAWGALCGTALRDACAAFFRWSAVDDRAATANQHGKKRTAPDPKRGPAPKHAGQP